MKQKKTKKPTTTTTTKIYLGDECEYANCNFESATCSSTDVSIHCSKSIIKNFCPKTCNPTVCRCGFDQCFNGGLFDSNACSCNCTDGI